MSLRRFALAVLLCLAASTGVAPAAPDSSSGMDALADAVAAAARLRGVDVPTTESPVAVPNLGVGLQMWSVEMLGGHGLVPADELRRLQQLPPAYRAAVATLASAMAVAARLRRAALAHVTPAEVALADRVALRAQFAPESVGRDEALEAVAIISRIDTAAMMRGAANVADAIVRARRLVASADAPGTVTCAPTISICVGSVGDDTYPDDIQLLIEPDGNDTYLNNAGGLFSSPVAAASGGCAFGGGTTGRGRPNLGCSPAPSTVCTYDTLNAASGRGDLPVVSVPGHDEPGSGGLNEGSCGSDERRDRLIAGTSTIAGDHDSRGVAALLDLGGSDTYTVPWSHNDPLFGLVEACYPGEPSRVNTNRDLFQGGALSGISVLWDSGDGDDRFRGRLNAQGSGHVGGVGILVTEGRGNDLFWADRLSQGSGIAGGVGILVNAKQGNHTYLLDAPIVFRNEFRPNGRDCVQEGRAGQGEGGFAGVGVLWSSHAGTAVYRAVTHLTQDAHPYAPVLDAGGAPVLVGGTDAQGSGESFPIPDTPGGLVVGAGLLFDDTDSDDGVCAPSAPDVASAGMVTGSSTSTGIDLSSSGIPSACGTFNLPPESEGLELDHLVAGAVGLRVVL